MISVSGADHAGPDPPAAAIKQAMVIKSRLRKDSPFPEPKNRTPGLSAVMRTLIRLEKRLRHKKMQLRCQGVRSKTPFQSDTWANPKARVKRP